MALPQLNRNKTGGWVLIGGSFVLLALLAHELFGVLQAVRARSWSSVEGTVVESRVVIGCGKGSSYHPFVRYRYSYNSIEYEGRRVAFGNVGCGSEQDARRTAAAYTAGMTVPVWVNPQSPREATLIVGNVLSESWFAIVILPVFGLGSFFMGRSLLRQEGAT